MSIGQVIIVGAACFIVAAFGIQGCRSYGEVNEVTFAHATALYSACNQESSERIEACAKLLEAAESSNSVSSKEASYLEGIITAGREGRWQEAQAMARELMTDQAGR